MTPPEIMELAESIRGLDAAQGRSVELYLELADEVTRCPEAAGALRSLAPELASCRRRMLVWAAALDRLLKTLEAGG